MKFLKLFTKNSPLIVLFIWFFLQIHFAATHLSYLSARNTDLVWNLITWGRISEEPLLFGFRLYSLPLKIFRFLLYGSDNVSLLLYFWQIGPHILWLCSLLLIVYDFRKRPMSAISFFMILNMYIGSWILFSFNPDQSFGGSAVFLIPVICIFTFYKSISFEVYATTGLLAIIGLTANPLGIFLVPMLMIPLWSRRDIQKPFKLLTSVSLLALSCSVGIVNSNLFQNNIQEIINSVLHLNPTFFPILLLMVCFFVISISPRFKFGRSSVIIGTVVFSIFLFVWAIDQKPQDIWIFYSANTVGYIFLFISTLICTLIKDLPDSDVSEMKWLPQTGYFILFSCLLTQLFFFQSGRIWTDKLKRIMSRSELPCTEIKMAESDDLSMIFGDGVSLTKKIILAEENRSVKKIILFEPNNCQKFLDTGKMKYDWGEQILADRQSYWNWDIPNLK